MSKSSRVLLLSAVRLLCFPSEITGICRVDRKICAKCSIVTRVRWICYRREAEITRYRRSGRNDLRDRISLAVVTGKNNVKITTFVLIDVYRITKKVVLLWIVYAVSVSLNFEADLCIFIIVLFAENLRYKVCTNMTSEIFICLISNLYAISACILRIFFPLYLPTMYIILYFIFSFFLYSIFFLFFILFIIFL
jgi:hypothetical protein